jgi:hypothetical protein
MRRVAALVIAAVALAAAAVGYAGSGSTGLPSGNAVFGGGHFLFFDTSDRDFSLSATKGLTGTAAKGTLIYSSGQTIVQITCMNISGNDAVVGGIVRSSTTEMVGTFDYIMLEDNSLPGSGGTPDAFSGLWVTSLKGKQPCPAFDASQPFFALTGGDVLVHAAT